MQVNSMPKHNPFQNYGRDSTPKLESWPVGTVVFFTDPGLSGRLGKIVHVGQAYRTLVSKEQMLHNVRYVDNQTGKTQVCPDSRCDGHREPTAKGCPICSTNVWFEQIRPLTQAEIDFFRKEDFLNDVPDDYKAPEPEA